MTLGRQTEGRPYTSFKNWRMSSPKHYANASVKLARISEVSSLERVPKVVSEAPVPKIQHIKLHAQANTFISEQLGSG